jgi:hydroxymethylglutaryl-CoA reductase (NADPH)
MATFEIPLWHSTQRGAFLSEKTSGIRACLIDDFMTRSVIFESDDLVSALSCKSRIENSFESVSKVVEQTGRFIKLKNMHVENVGKLLYLRLGVETGNAAGHNMATKAADAVAGFVVSVCENLIFLSVSGNCCTDKKVSAVNGILGRGKRVSAEIVVPRDQCIRILRVTPEQISDLNVKKNLLGSILSGGVRTANSHYGNAALAVFLASGQDAANVTEASQGITFAEVSDGDLYFSVNLPNVIVGTAGNGKNLPFVLKNLELMGCSPADPTSSRRLAMLIAGTTLCAELSLMAALCNPGELTAVHMRLERDGQ